MQQIIAFLTTILIFIPLLLHADFLKDTEKKSPLIDKTYPSVFELQKTFHSIYNLYKNSVVFISTEKTIKLRFQNPFVHPFIRDFLEDEFKRKERMKKLRGLGTGFIISTDGYICTNYHVVKDIDKITIVINNEHYEAKIVGFDQLLDIALLKINSAKKLQPVYFGNSDNVKIGDMVVAIGNPFGFDKTYTFGIISATGRNISIAENSMLQTDASINKGNSGGPLINLNGEVIGVNSMIYSATGGSLGIGFAIPINLAKKSLLMLKQYGKIKRGFIGVYMSPVPKEYSGRAGLASTEGALIKKVMEGGPADKGGLKVGDIVLSINGKKVKNHVDLQIKIMKSEINDTIKIIVWRNGKHVDLQIKVLERKK